MVEAQINSSNSNNVDNLQHTPVSSEDDEDNKDKGGDEFVEGGYSTSEPSVNDVLCGRGGSINSHPGNERFRILVEKRKRVYLTARFKREKRLIACSIVSEIRALDPPGRFLSKDTKSGLWKDIGDEKARDKTSQALRENAPSIRAEIETEICEKRAEMMLTQQQQTKDESTTRVNAPLHLPPQPQHGMLPPPVHPYYGAWGYPFYGYGVPPPLGHGPVPMPAAYPPHHPPLMMTQPPPGHYDPYYPHGYAGTTPDPYLHQRQQHPPLVPPTTTTASSTTQPNIALAPKPSSPHSTKSALEQTTEFVATGAESLKNWTKRSLNIGTTTSTTTGGSTTSRGGTGTSSSSGGVGAGVSTTASHEGSKSIITYKHDDETKKRRMVKFRDDDSNSNFSLQRVRGRRVRPCYSPLNVNGNDSLVDQLDDDVYEPEKLEDFDPNAENVVDHHRANSSSNHTFIAQMTQLLSPTMMGSWDLGNIVCGNDTSDPVPFHRRQFKDSSDPQDMYESYPGDEDNDAIEWEGQEVQLVDESKNNANTPRHYDDDRRYPPERTPKSNAQHPSTNDNASSSIAFSSLGSCHSWIPEQFGTAASYFGRGGGMYDDDEAEEIATSGGSGSGGGVGNKSCGSHDMTEISAGGNSLGGNSLTRVFDNHPPPSPTNERYLLEGEKTGYMASPNMNHRVLSRIPSWERNLRSKSPLSVASEDDEGEDDDDQFDIHNTNNNDDVGSNNNLQRRYNVRLNSEPSTPIANNDPMSPSSYHHPSYFLSSPVTAGLMAAIRSIDEDDMAFG